VLALVLALLLLLLLLLLVRGEPVLWCCMVALTPVVTVLSLLQQESLVREGVLSLVALLLQQASSSAPAQEDGTLLPLLQLLDYLPVRVWVCGCGCVGVRVCVRFV